MPALKPPTATTILIVDDDPPFRRAAAELLTDRGFRVVGYAGTAEEAVSESRRLGPDALLLDVRLPDGNGVALVTTLRAVTAPPVIILTSSDPVAVPPERLRASGASAFIPKSQLAHSDLQTLLADEARG
ncbi:MAG TPA: response regulator transcription factor [Solirubrobacteraceae bacterium]|nr:response regulator transcription factor [Solirubrobacteraceae bacterium]